MYYAEVILPVPVSNTFTYAIPAQMAEAVAVGSRVIVPFGRRKYLTGIVRSIGARAPEGFDVKEIAFLPDSAPILRHPQLKLWDWIADYYMAPVGDVMRAALPSGLKVESETFVELNPDFDFLDVTLEDNEAIICQTLAHDGHMTVDQLGRATNISRITSTVSRMLDAGQLVISEKVVERYRPLRKTCIRPTFSHDKIKDAFETVKGAPKQEKLLMALIEMSGINRQPSELNQVGRQELLDRADVTAPILNAVAKKGLAEQYTIEINRFKFDGVPSGRLPQLTDAQRNAMDAITEQWREKATVLLHGVTSSGKTEIYSHLIDSVLQKGNQVLYLVPEIALTTQLTQRLQRIFGNTVVVYHSKFSDNERVDIWKTMLADSRPRVILGARSALFLPFSRLGLVIVDEEHETSYKQSDPAPRYNGRDVAIVLASMHGAKTLLGSATPSIETYYKATQGKFGLVTLDKRYGDLPLPPITIVDMTRARKRGETNGTFSLDTISRINASTRQGRQAILFRNRRGYAPIVRCKACAWTPKCRDCDVGLTYHQYSRRMECHYCGATYPLPELCPQCGQPTVEVVGYGTERIEDDIATIFPTSKVIRMDLDTTRNKDSYENLIEDFSQHKADILVGTQMVTKGLDFKDVNTVAVLNADEMLCSPDFKASERAFNMLEQVAGRAGRADGDDVSVIIQAWDVNHPILPFVTAHDYRAYYEHEIEERRKFNYPPFTRIIYIYIKHRDSRLLEAFSDKYARRLRERLGTRVSGPDRPKVARVKTLYIQKIMIKAEQGVSLPRLRDELREVWVSMASDPMMKSATIYYDVDP